MLYTSLALILVPFSLHCTVGHGSAVTTANSTTDLPLLPATNTGFPMPLFVPKSSKEVAVTTGSADGKEGRKSRYCGYCMCVCCVHACMCVWCVCACMHVCVCVCSVFESLPQQLPVEKGGREHVHCILSQ